MKWTPKELEKLKSVFDKKPAWMTDYELAGKLASSFKKSPESIRWQLRQLARDIKVAFPKILLLDIETMYIVASVWGTRKQYVAPIQVQKDWSVVCWSAKWLFGKEHFGQVVTPEEARNHDDKSVLSGMWDLVNEADMVITYNGDNFDMKRLNTRWLVAGYPPPMFYKSIDVYQTVSTRFDFTYKKLDWVAEVLGIGRKIETSFKWWTECEKGNPVYLKKMLEYNKWDVDLLEEAYLKIRPWITGHPNMNVYNVSGVQCCPTCGETHLSWEGKYSTPLGLYKAFRCQKCGAIGRSTLKKYKLNKAEVQ